MKTLCAWHPEYFGSELVLKDDGKGGPDSHGICPACAAILEQDKPRHFSTRFIVQVDGPDGWACVESLSTSEEAEVIADAYRQVWDGVVRVIRKETEHNEQYSGPRGGVRVA